MSNVRRPQRDGSRFRRKYRNPRFVQASQATTAISVRAHSEPPALLEARGAGEYSEVVQELHKDSGEHQGRYGHHRAVRWAINVTVLSRSYKGAATVLHPVAP